MTTWEEQRRKAREVNMLKTFGKFKEDIKSTKSNCLAMNNYIIDDERVGTTGATTDAEYSNIPKDIYNSKNEERSK